MLTHKPLQRQPQSPARREAFQPRPIRQQPTLRRQRQVVSRSRILLLHLMQYTQLQLSTHLSLSIQVRHNTPKQRPIRPQLSIRSQLNIHLPTPLLQAIPQNHSSLIHGRILLRPTVRRLMPSPSKLLRPSILLKLLSSLLRLTQLLLTQGRLHTLARTLLHRIMQHRLRRP
jgi:hypothetical protein